jgi:hypothetical protein
LNYTRPSPHPPPLHIHAPEIRLGLDVTYVFCIFELSTQFMPLPLALAKKWQQKWNKIKISTLV